MDHRALLRGQDEEEVTPCIDKHGNITEQQESHRPPSSSTSSGGLMRTLEAPMSLREAIWSSTVPRETLEDIRRLGVVSGKQSGFGGGD